jgi:hypothetical protein
MTQYLVRSAEVLASDLYESLVANNTPKERALEIARLYLVEALGTVYTPRNFKPREIHR